MKLLAFFTNHTHYWGVPHLRHTDKKLIQVCYECSTEREVLAPLIPSTDVQSDSPTSASPQEG
jgi:hypothetical protein